VASDVTEQIRDKIELQNKNTYLEHAAKILRHDMHSGINTYIPRGIRSLERRLAASPEVVEKLKLHMPLRLLKEGLAHTQKVYSGVREFTNLVKPGAELEMQVHDLGDLLREYLSLTAYRRQVVIGDLPAVEVNGPLFCTAIDNLIRNGLKYNDSPTKVVRIESEGSNRIIITDNGRGMTKKEFEEYSKPYIRKEGQTETGSGLGLNICIAILREHNFSVTCEKRRPVGTRIRIQTHD
jgi:two-component system sensor histidine kinase CpxA